METIHLLQHPVEESGPILFTSLPRYQTRTTDAEAADYFASVSADM
jgi:hypothetical protein